MLNPFNANPPDDAPFSRPLARRELNAIGQSLAQCLLPQMRRPLSLAQRDCAVLSLLEPRAQRQYLGLAIYSHLTMADEDNPVLVARLAMSGLDPAEITDWTSTINQRRSQINQAARTLHGKRIVQTGVPSALKRLLNPVHSCEEAACRWVECAENIIAYAQHAPCTRTTAQQQEPAQ
ncbi:hypothetical protein [Polycladidibacter hongkongensis]|uniref:hypothetical protein n=1 Tax=Polycladidibacter hongkongensis TaxID=1647556 RepID=UPI00082E6540|nr:hypothetical protein [Pseudovibrio hongkongensis]